MTPPQLASLLLLLTGTLISLFVDEASDQLRQLGDPEKGLQFRYYPGALSMDVHGSGERLNRSRGYAVTGSPPLPPPLCPVTW